MNQFKYNVRTFDVASQLSNDIVRVVHPKHVEVLQLELYNGKGDSLTHVKTFQTLSSYFAHDQRLLEKMFTRTLRDRALQWHCYFPSYYIVLLFNNWLMLLFKNFIIKLVLKLL